MKKIAITFLGLMMISSSFASTMGRVRYIQKLDKIIENANCQEIKTENIRVVQDLEKNLESELDFLIQYRNAELSESERYAITTQLRQIEMRNSIDLDFIKKSRKFLFQNECK